jgi:DNA-binding FadR family transcriptional regulator
MSRSEQPFVSRFPDGLRDVDDANVSRSEAVARLIGNIIVEKSLPVGERLGTKSDLRQQFGVASGTMNEAVRLLETRGIVKARPGPSGGIFVAAPEPKMRLSHLILGLRGMPVSVADGLRVRNALEPLVAMSAARQATPEQIEELWAIVDEMKAHLGDAGGYLEANWRLHRRMAELSDNALLTGIYLALLDFVRDSIAGVAPDDEFTAHSRKNLALHRELVKAVASGDEGKARKAAERHTPLTEAVARADPPAAARASV